MPDTRIPLIAVPTAAGTGSEITCVSMLSDHEMGLKKPLVCDGFYPVLALVAPELTYSVLRHITACEEPDNADAREKMAEAITELEQYIGVMPDLKQFALDDERLEALVQASKHPNLRNNPVEITEEMLREMYVAMR